MPGAPDAKTKGLGAMNSIAMIAARFCGRILPEYPETSFSLSEPAQKPPWRRAPRTKAALAVRALKLLRRPSAFWRMRMSPTPSPCLGSWLSSLGQG